MVRYAVSVLVNSSLCVHGRKMYFAKKMISAVSVHGKFSCLCKFCMNIISIFSLVDNICGHLWSC